MAESSGNCSAPELPRHLIHHILSFLSCRESAKASILSKAWFWAWQTRPELEFNSDIYTSKKLIQVGSMWYFSLSEIHKIEICEELFEQIKKTLKPYSRQGICVDTVNLTIGLIADSQWNPLV
ncbi:hypothetical protein ACH5RR_032977 [Cinchona calisaya]|uniref:F-box domain-containing protein n=1 Tax=Cinchona calisaya TaxID=153742 RepID=A0ABD2YNS1_9GENT